MSRIDDIPEIQIANSIEEFDSLLGNGFSGVTVAYFWGHQCPNCEVFAAHLPQIREGLRGKVVRFLKANVYTIEALGTRFGLFGIPTFVLHDGTKSLGRMTSFHSDDFFVQVIEEALTRSAVSVTSSRTQRFSNL